MLLLLNGSRLKMKKEQYHLCDLLLFDQQNNHQKDIDHQLEDEDIGKNNGSNNEIFSPRNYLQMEKTYSIAKNMLSF